jgi:hypothetical protein
MDKHTFYSVDANSNSRVTGESVNESSLQQAFQR